MFSTSTFKFSKRYFRATYQLKKSILTGVSLMAFTQTLRVISTSIPFLWRYNLFKKFPKTMWTLSSVPLLGCGVLSYNAYEKHPITNRGRFLFLDEKDSLVLADNAHLELVNEHYTKFVSKSDRRYKKIEKIARDIISIVGDCREWELYLIDAPVENAFVLGNGKMYFFTGILKNKSTPELAAIMAHEIAHVLSRHSQESEGLGIVSDILKTFLHSVVYSLTINLPVLGDLGGLTLNTAYNPLIILPHSRMAEYEADVIGLYLMALAGYHPSGAIKLFKTWEKEYPMLEEDAYFSTHPLHEERASELEGHLEDAEEVYINRKVICKRVNDLKGNNGKGLDAVDMALNAVFGVGAFEQKEVKEKKK